MMVHQCMLEYSGWVSAACMAIAVFHRAFRGAVSKGYRITTLILSRLRETESIDIFIFVEHLPIFVTANGYRGCSV